MPKAVDYCLRLADELAERREKYERSQFALELNTSYDILSQAEFEHDPLVGAIFEYCEQNCFTTYYEPPTELYVDMVSVLIDKHLNMYPEWNLPVLFQLLHN